MDTKDYEKMTNSSSKTESEFKESKIYSNSFDDYEESGNILGDDNNEASDSAKYTAQTDLNQKNPFMKFIWRYSLLALYLLFIAVTVYYSSMPHKEETKPKKEIKIKPKIERKMDKFFVEVFDNMPEEQLIKTINDCLENDYSYYSLSDEKYALKQVESKLLNLCLQKDFGKALDFLLTKGFSHKYSSDININSLLNKAILNNKNNCKEVLIKHGGKISKTQ